MTIIYKLLDGGAFVAGDTKTGRTCYAYPTSPHASAAKKVPAYVAEAMLADENRLATYRDEMSNLREYDARNFALIRGELEA